MPGSPFFTRHVLQSFDPGCTWTGLDHSKESGGCPAVWFVCGHRVGDSSRGTEPGSASNRTAGASMSQTAIQEIRPWEQPFWRPARGKAGVLFYLVLIHVLAVIGLILFPLPSVRVLGFTLLFTALGGFGTTVCYHRMLAHRTLKLNKVVEHVLVFFAMFNGSGAPASWVAYHRHHHSRTDTPEDISSPKQGGFWWSHLRC